MDIAEVARRAGVPASTLRYYEEKGLIAPIGRKGLRRLYKPGVLDQLALIALGQAAGFSLDEIAMMSGGDGKPKIDRRMLSEKAAQIDRMIIKLRAMSKGLHHAARCPAPNHMECPTFRRLLSAAATGVLTGPENKARARRRKTG